MDQTLELSNDPAGIDTLFDKVEQILQEQQVHIGSMKVDGEFVYEDYKDYLLERIPGVKDIEIETLTLQQYFHEVMLSANQYLDRLIPGLTHLSGEFYKNSGTEAWNGLNDVIEGLLWVSQMVHFGTGDKLEGIDGAEFEKASEQLNQKVKDLLGAVESEDTTLIGDLLQYEVLESLKELKAHIQKTIDNEVVRHDVN